MRGYVVAALATTAACGSVDNNKKDAAVQTDDSALTDTPMLDAMIDAGPNCMSDAFDGTSLGGHWTVTQGAAPTYSVAGGKISITDSPLVTTPSNANESWINEMDTDKGNQLGWAQAIGTGDFTVRSHIDWTSNNAQLMISAIAVADSNGRMLAYVGAYDGGQAFLGGDYARMAVAGTDTNSPIGPLVDPGSIDVRLERVSATIKAYVNGTEVLSNADTSAITHVSMLTVPYRLNANNYEFGTAEFTFVEVCRP